MKGWFNESVRHSLARKGIRTININKLNNINTNIKNPKIKKKEIELKKYYNNRIKEILNNKKLSEQNKKDFVKELIKNYKEEIENLKEIEKAEIPKEKIINVRWVYNSNWGNYNPIATDEKGNEVKGITGANYDKFSTAVAKILDNDKGIQKLLIENQDKLTGTNGVNTKTTPFINYGIGIAAIRNIFNKVGYNFKHISNKSNDIIIITKPFSFKKEKGLSKRKQIQKI